MELLGQWRHIENRTPYTVYGVGKVRVQINWEWSAAVFYRADETGELFAQEISAGEWMARFERVKSF